VNDKAGSEVQRYTDYNTRQNSNCRIQGRQMLNLLEASYLLVVTFYVIPNLTYKRLENSSNELMTAFDKAIVTQMLVNAWLRQNELGIKAGFPF
jgi:hypothetical protein